MENKRKRTKPSDKQLQCYFRTLHQVLRMEGNRRLQSLKDLHNKLLCTLPCKLRYDVTTYPRLTLQLLPTQMHDLLRSQEGSVAYITEQVHASKDNILAKLLYAVAWKNGDLPKIYNIVDGIHESNADISKERKSFVFYQFGRHLADPKQPIMDRHTLRAQQLCNAEFGRSKQKNKKIWGEIRRKKFDYISRTAFDDYLDWVDKRLPYEERTETIVALLDQIMFMLGKTAKK